MMTLLDYVVAGRKLDTVAVPAGGGAIVYANGRARPVVDGLLRRSHGDRRVLAEWSNGYAQLRRA